MCVRVLLLKLVQRVLNYGLMSHAYDDHSPVTVATARAVLLEKVVTNEFGGRATLPQRAYSKARVSPA